MSRLSLIDAGWLLLERRERPMHVGGLQLFDLPDDLAPGTVTTMVEAAREHGDVRPPFDRRLAHPYGRAGLYHRWVRDEVDLEHHVRHLALPAPGRIRELLALVSQLHGSLLDRHRPLWEAYVIEGIEERRLAMYTKIHHAVLDGVAAMRQLLRGMTDDPDARDLPPPWAQQRPQPDSGDDAPALVPPAVQQLGRLMGLLVDQVRGAPRLTAAVARHVARARRDAADVLPFQAPRSMLNQRLTAARRYVAQSYRLERIRTVADAVDGTINDVLLAMCAAALRTYLSDRGALPDDPLVALVPVSFRDRIGGDTGNAVTLVPTTLATDLADPADRFARIQTSMTHAKDRLAGLDPPQMLTYAALLVGPIVLGQLTGLAGRMRPSFNVVISNVPGPTRRLYWNGLPMTGLYPLSLLVEGQTMNITQTSYAGSMEFGITADRRALPSVQRMIDHLEDALAELEAVAGL